MNAIDGRRRRVVFAPRAGPAAVTLPAMPNEASEPATSPYGTGEHRAYRLTRHIQDYSRTASV
jgi:hypothetical protein